MVRLLQGSAKNVHISQKYPYFASKMQISVVIMKLVQENTYRMWARCEHLVPCLRVSWHYLKGILARTILKFCLGYIFFVRFSVVFYNMKLLKASNDPIGFFFPSSCSVSILFVQLYKCNTIYAVILHQDTKNPAKYLVDLNVCRMM